MDTFSTWASSQPIWAQVFIGLFLFFVVLPIILAVFYYAWFALTKIVEVANDVFENAAKEIEPITALLFPAIRKVSKLIATLAALGGAVWLIAYFIRNLTLENDRTLIYLLVGSLAAVSLPFVVYFSSTKVRATIHEWRKAIGADRETEA